MYTKISSLTNASTLAGDELVPVVQGGTTKKTTANSIGRINLSALDDTAIASLANKEILRYNGTKWANGIDEGYHYNRRTRENITSRVSPLANAVAEQNLAKYGFTIGDYFVGASGYTYIIADMNTNKGSTTPYCISGDHIGIVVDTHATSAFETSGDVSALGYGGSTLHTFLTTTVLNAIKSDFIALFGGSTGLEHIYSQSLLLTTALANWAWQSDQYICALSEAQLGYHAWGANGFQTGQAAKPLALFLKYKWTEIFGGEYFWLKDIESASVAAHASLDGGAGGDGVSDALCAVGLINFH